jgi:predicted nucleic acid-binding protein
MRVVDTSVWIELLIMSPTGKTLVADMPPVDEIIVPTIVQLELAKWLARELPDLVEDVIGATDNCRIVPLDSAIALQAAEIGRTARLATADSIIYATAIYENADLLTCDAHFQDMPNVIYRPKARH